MFRQTDRMEIEAVLESPVGPPELYPWIAELARYPRWLSIVTEATPAAVAPGDRGPAYFVHLRAKIGPLSRSKRLRMVQTAAVADQSVRFERHEADGQEHSPWVLQADISVPTSSTRGAAQVANPVATTSAGIKAILTMRLHYGGGLFEPVVERLLTGEIEAAKPRLLACLISG